MHENLITELEAIELAEYIHLEHVVSIKQAAAALRELQAELAQLRAFKTSMTTAIAQAVSDALAQADEQHKADVAELQAEITRKDRQLEKSECEYQELRAKLSIVNKFMATNYEDSGVAMFQAELIAAMKEWK